MLGFDASISGILAASLLAGAALAGCSSRGDVLAEGDLDPLHIAVDAESIYYIDRDGQNSLRKMPKPSGTPRTIATHVQEYAIAGHALFFRDDQNALFETTIDGDTLGQIVAGSKLRNGLVATDDRVYWIDIGSDLIGTIFSMPGDGSEQPSALGEAGHLPDYLRIDAAGNLFWVTLLGHASEGDPPAAVRMLPAAGGGAVTLFENPDREFHGLAADGTFVYFDSGEGDLSRVPIAGGDAQLLAHSDDGFAGVTAFGDRLYAHGSDGCIVSLPAAGGEIHEIACGHPESIAVDEQRVYWANPAYTTGGGEHDLGPTVHHPGSIASAPR